MSGVLAALLTRGAAFDAEYQGGLSNHLPMALVALHRLGASDVRLNLFAGRYATRLETAPAPATWPAGDAWQGRFGQREAWPAYRQLFAEWLTHEDAGSVLLAALPPLLAGCGGAAFHGLIRCAYAVRMAQETGHETELADALAYWACRHLRLATLATNTGSLDVAELLASLPATPSDAPLIFQRMRAVAAAPKFAATVARLRIDAGTLPALALQAAALYARSGNFVALHLVTSAHALRVLLPFVDEPLHAVRDYACAYAAAHVAAAASPGAMPRLLPWKTIIESAIASDDEHVIKLVDSCVEQRAIYGGRAWRQAASRAFMNAAPAPPATPRSRRSSTAARG